MGEIIDRMAQDTAEPGTNEDTRTEVQRRVPGVRERKLDLQEPGNGDGNQYRPRCLPGLQDIFTYNFQSGAAGNGPGKI